MFPPNFFPSARALLWAEHCSSYL